MTPAIQAVARSEGEEGQVRDEREVAEVGCADGVAEFQGGDSDQEVRQGDTDAAGLRFAIDAPGVKRDGERDRMNGDAHGQFVKELLPDHETFGAVGAGGEIGRAHV